MRLNKIWTLARAIRVGLVAGLIALLLWPIHAISPERVRPLFVAALAVTAAGGASILWMSAADLLTVRRDRRILPARLFDLALGLAMTVPPALALLSLLNGSG
ncbi:hypothetical protein GON01_14820 [Sphingomonas sp. MAH-20]|uniref:Uncharacterized protein n=1 Tax=Sphingomonas horti TaxID=2682842 RepID=A0A6I4J517_9SPHN|nr:MULTISPECIES: hypothetical protein [Sphingomonas]MBA2919170.1 hypothetical protein [Sphingomonas sp. CGMCC 1.13658]MVO79203.1 hypothetical protein [Sphingomonas horti]